MSRGGRLGWWLAAALAACAARAAGDWSDCEPACRCKWSSGKKSAVCAGAGLRAPPPLSADIQALDLHDNELRALPRDAFAALDLLNLQRINLRATRLRTLHRDAFRHLRILVELDLADNELAELPRDTFRGNDRLRLLVLSGNPLTSLVADQFPPLPHLHVIDVQNCRLTLVHATALQNLRALESVDLRGNRLAELHVRTFDLPALKALALSGNPWRCDCLLRPFRDWFLATNLGTEEIICVEPPALADRAWRDIPSTNMGCTPEVRPSARIVRAEPGGEVTFGCFVRGDPEPQVRWFFNGAPLENSTVAAEADVDEAAAGSNVDTEVVNVSKARWSNISLSNVTVDAAGEWTCSARSANGDARAAISLILPRARAETARAAPGLPALLGALGGALGALAALGLALACACWRARRRRVPPSRSFTDQEKKLLDASLATSCERSSADLGSPSDLELAERSPSSPSAVGNFEPVHITIEGCDPSTYPPPPPEFALPSRSFGGIFISVQVAASERYPDLLGGGATLPRRARACCTVPAYDNMGPRVTAAGSSTWSLPGSEPQATPQPPQPPQPAEFVSL